MGTPACCMTASLRRLIGAPVEGLDLPPCGYRRCVPVTEDDGGYSGIGRMVGTADLGNRLVQLVLSEELDLMGCPPTPDRRTSPLIAVVLECAQSPTGNAPGPAIIGHDHGLIGQTVSFLRWPTAGELDGKVIIVLNNRCTRFLAHRLIPKPLTGCLYTIIASLGTQRNTEHQPEPPVRACLPQLWLQQF
jgi:hypothetical protein